MQFQPYLLVLSLIELNQASGKYLKQSFKIIILFKVIMVKENHGI